MKALLLVMMCLAVFPPGLSYDSARANEGIATIWQMDHAAGACSMLLQAAADCSLCHTTVPEVNSYGQDFADYVSPAEATSWSRIKAQYFGK